MCLFIHSSQTLTVMLIIFGVSYAHSIEQATVGELFTYKIEPTLFNWTHQAMNEQFQYRPSLEGYPDLPSWLRYEYSKEYHHAGFLYGTPPDKLAGQTIHLHIVALNKENYETRKVVLPIYVSCKIPIRYIVKMKIDNLNWFHLMDAERVENLRNIFRKELWPNSENDLSLIFMDSVVNMGDRLSLSPQTQREGVIVALGSAAPFSEHLMHIFKRVRPLSPVQELFENAGFKLDWCEFEIMFSMIPPIKLFGNFENEGIADSELYHAKKRICFLSIIFHNPVCFYINESRLEACHTELFLVMVGILAIVLIPGDKL